MDARQLRCPTCGSEVNDRDLHVRFTWPDPVLRVREEQRKNLPQNADIISVCGVSAFARVLLPVELDGGYRLTFGTWIGLGDKEVYDQAVRLWHDPAYPSLVLTGTLANAIEPWGPAIMAPTRAVVRDPGKVPYVEALPTPDGRNVVDETWPRDWVMSAVPAGLWHRH
jgi:hypothetical protein